MTRSSACHVAVVNVVGSYNIYPQTTIMLASQLVSCYGYVGNLYIYFNSQLVSLYTELENKTYNSFILFCMPTDILTLDLSQVHISGDVDFDYQGESVYVVVSTNNNNNFFSF